MNDAIQRFIGSNILDGKRIFTTNKKYGRFIMPKKKSYSFKPEGLWYSIGSSWIDWCLGEQFEGIGKYIYEINLSKKANVLFLDTEDKVFKFSDKYKKVEFPYSKYNSTHIDWKRVRNDYDGIEVNPYFYSLRWSHNLIWYYGWDIPSGCVWKAAAKKNIILLAEYKEKKKEFVLI